jgi:N-acylneuraminate cytidylyltransferase
MYRENNEVVAVVPVREGSSRIKNKNFLPFGEYPTLVHNKIQQLKNARCFDHIYLSSDSQRVREIAESCGVEFLYRNPEMCTSKPRWDEVVVHIMNTVPNDPHVVWAMVTSPLFVRYKEAVELYLSNLDAYDSLVGIKQIREYLVDEAGRPLFYSFGVWHPYSNEIKPIYAINDVIFIAKKPDQIYWRYWVGRKPFLFHCDPVESIDINFPEDMEMAIVAQQAMEKRKKDL